MRKILCVLITALLLAESLFMCGISASAATMKKAPVYKVGDSFTVSMTANKKNDYSTSWDNAYYACFVPEKDGDYEFDCKSLNFYGEAAYSALLVNAKDEPVSYAYAIGEDSFYIDLVGHLKAGETYYYLVHYANQGFDNTVNLKIKIKKHKHHYITTGEDCPDAEYMMDYGVDENGKGVTICKTQGCFVDGVDVYFSRFSVDSSRKRYVYDGTAKEPKPVFKDMRGKVFKPDFKYKVVYDKNTDVGLGWMKVKADGLWYHPRFKINPQATKIRKLTSRKGGFTVRWKKQAVQTTGYQIRYASDKSFKNAKTVTVRDTKTLSKTVRGLKKGKRYYVKVRTYKKKKYQAYYSAWSEVQSVKTK